MALKQRKEAWEKLCCVVLLQSSRILYTAMIMEMNHYKYKARNGEMKLSKLIKGEKLKCVGLGSSVHLKGI